MLIKVNQLIGGPWNYPWLATTLVNTQLNWPSHHHGDCLPWILISWLFAFYHPPGRFTGHWERHRRITLPSSNRCWGGTADLASAMGKHLDVFFFDFFSIQIYKRTWMYLWFLNPQKTSKNLFEVDFPMCVWGVLVTIILSIQYDGGVSRLGDFLL